MDWSEILNILLGGGLLATAAGIATLRATVKRANAEAAQAQAQAESVRITNSESATRVLVENIVKPLKNELNATREELQATKREMASTKRTIERLARAVECANRCRYSLDCPVVRELAGEEYSGVTEPPGQSGREGDRERESETINTKNYVRNNNNAHDKEGGMGKA